MRLCLTHVRGRFLKQSASAPHTAFLRMPGMASAAGGRPDAGVDAQDEVDRCVWGHVCVHL